jgi:hypothetical protein
MEGEQASVSAVERANKLVMEWERDCRSTGLLFGDLIQRIARAFEQQVSGAVWQEREHAEGRLQQTEAREAALPCEGTCVVHCPVSQGWARP